MVILPRWYFPLLFLLYKVQRSAAHKCYRPLPTFSNPFETLFFVIRHLVKMTKLKFTEVFRSCILNLKFVLSSLARLLSKKNWAAQVLKKDEGNTACCSEIQNVMFLTSDHHIHHTRSYVRQPGTGSTRHTDSPITMGTATEDHRSQKYYKDSCHDL